MPTILIKKGYLLDPNLPFERKDILIQDDLISQVATNVDFQADIVIDASDKVIIPGLISCHNHTYITPARGFVDNILSEPWLIYCLEYGIGQIYNQHATDNKTSLRDLYVWCAIAAVELLKTGTTSLLDMGPALINPIDFDKQVDVVANAFIDTGIRAVIAPMYWNLNFSEFLPLHLLDNLKREDMALFDEAPYPTTEEMTQSLRSVLRRWQGRNPRISLGLGPLEADHCTRELMEQTVEIASEFDATLQTHLLPMKSRVIVGNKMFGQPVVKYLESINFLGPRTSFAHAIWLDEQGIQTLADHNCSVVHSPISNVKLGEGVAPIQTMRDHGLNVALGVDCCGCNDSLNMFEAMKFGAIIHMLNEQPRKWVSARDVFTMCLNGGAKVIRKKVGLLQPGYLADLIILGTDNLFMIPKENFINQLVYSGLGNSVETVIVGGQVVVENKKVKTVNEKDLYAEGKESIRKIYRDVPSLQKGFAPMGDLLERVHRAVMDYKLPFSRLIQR